jgi:hypothetical protein
MLKGNSLIATPPNLLNVKKASNLNALNANVFNYLNLTFSFFKTVRLATTENITLSGFQIIDGVQTVNGDRVLVKDQTDVTTEGVYVVNSDNWIRPNDCTVGSIASGMVVYVADGVKYNKNYLICTSPPISYIGISDLLFYNTSSTSFFPLDPSLIREGAIFYNINGIIGVELNDGYRYTEDSSNQILKLSKSGYKNKIVGKGLSFLSGDNESGKGGNLNISAQNIHCNINNTTTIQSTNNLNITSGNIELNNLIGNSINIVAGGTFNYNNVVKINGNILSLTSSTVSDGSPIVLGNNRQGFINLNRSIPANGSISVLVTSNNYNDTLNVNIQSYLGNGRPVIWSLVKTSPNIITINIKNYSNNAITSENIQIVYIFL